MHHTNPRTESASGSPAIIVERHVNGEALHGRSSPLQLCLDEQDGECHGYVVTVRLPASYISKVSRVRLQCA